MIGVRKEEFKEGRRGEAVGRKGPRTVDRKEVVLALYVLGMS